MKSRTLITFLLPSALPILYPADPAAALEACVRCDNPFAIYRCQVNDPGLSANAPIALLCITELAKKNGHATCAVTRDSAAACGGDIAEVTPSPDTPLPQAPPTGVVAATPQPDGAPLPEPGTALDELPRTGEAEPEPDAAPPEPKTPQTVEELAKQTAKASQKGLKQAGEVVVDAAKSTGQTIEKTGDAIGSAAKKTWRCITSLFGEC
ncbi:MAG: hypothetical protein KJ622_02960 [Alphaproteobacteria bacterium]|nr:hypothetical protein [Alphaproteobacteria bacterium]